MTTSRATRPSKNQSIDQSDAGLLLIRAILGVVFLYHGVWKLGAFGGPGLDAIAGFFGQIGIPFPALQAPFVAGLEVAGGLALLVGLGTRISAGLLAFAMLVASATAHDGFSNATNGFELPLTLAVVSAGIALLGPGRLALSALVPAVRGSRLREVFA